MGMKPNMAVLQDVNLKGGTAVIFASIGMGKYQLTTQNMQDRRYLQKLAINETIGKNLLPKYSLIQRGVK